MVFSVRLPPVAKRYRDAGAVLHSAPMEDLWRVRPSVELAAMSLDDVILLYRRQVHSLHELEESGFVPRPYIDILETTERWAVRNMAESGQ